MSATPKLMVRNVTLRFERRGHPPLVALDDVSIDVGDREFSVIVGPSGCGKSTLLLLVAGLLAPTAGRMQLGDRLIAAPGPERGMVFQSYTLFPWLTVRRNIEFGPRLLGRPAAARADIARHYVSEVGLTGFEDAYPRQLSGGMRQRVALARALANDPEMLLMDEPFGALDSQTRWVMQQLLLRVWEHTHKTVLFVTHDIDEAILLGDRVYVMTARPGRIKEEIAIPIVRPRTVDVVTTPAFIALKRRILGLLQEEVQKSLGLHDIELRAAREQAAPALT
jgi:NitT/TauT family transport system ATP-binding protein